MASNLRADKAFMGTNGISLSAGATTPDLQQAETKKSMIAVARTAILLCDSSKIGGESFARFADLAAIDTLITEQMDEDERVEFEERGVEVVTPG